MTPERWRQVTALFHSARAREAADRAAFLDQACAGDASLRADVEGLLAAEATRFGDAPIALSSLPQLSAGTTFGSYRVEALIGAGGMGQVYRATDTRLRRAVALKVLTPDLAMDPDFGSRFKREAQLLAALNHPNIAAIHGLEEAGGIQALVLEYVQGPTLAERLVAGPLAAREALPIARQIASALEAAHERGIVHRDLKPANIKVTPAGIVKVLDFGIARLSASGPGAAPPTAAPTRTGTVVGTPAYMSPEQARGLAVDKRTDIWAFGCVLFEMLTGKGAFAADTASDSLAKVIEREPDWRALPAGVPESIQRLLRRCLQKDPANRLHDIADARIEIAEATSGATRSETTPAATRSRTGVIVVTLAATALAIVAALIWSRPAPSTGQPLEFGVTYPNNYMPAVGVAISPDGRRIAANVWSNIGDIWVHTLDGSQPQPLPGGEKGSSPFWKPDSSMLAFAQGGQIVTMSPSGGPKTVVTALKGVAAGAGTWSRDDVILYTAAGKVFRVPASGGSAPVEVPITGADGTFNGPTFLPDGRHFLFCATSATGDSGSLYVATRDGGRARELGKTVCPGGFAPPNSVLFVRAGSIFAQKIDLSSFKLVGDPQVVASGVSRGSTGPWPSLTVSASDTGTLAFPAPRGGSSLGRLTWFDQTGRAIGTIEPVSDDVEYLNPEICPTNDSLVAAHRFDPETGAWHIWLIDGSRSNAARRLTSNAESDYDPAWTFDGKAVVYASAREGRWKLYLQPITGGPPVELMDATQFRNPMPIDVAQDGRIFFSDLNRSIWSFRPGDPLPARLGPPQLSYGPHLSPDGKWLAYSVTEGGAFELYVERFPGGVPRSKISTGAGVHPRWTNGGKAIAYWNPPGGIELIDLTLTDQEIRAGQPHTILSQPVLTLIDARSAYDITRDGKKILARQQAGPPKPGVRVIVNWAAKLK